MRWLAGIALVGCTQSHSMMTPPPDGHEFPEDGLPDMMQMPPPPSASDLVAKLATCTRVGGNYATDSGGTQDIPICGLFNGVFWKADLDVDCDGKPSAECNSMTDPAYQAQTSATDSHGDYLDAAALPYVV